MELLDELAVMNRQLDEALKTLRQNGIAKAQAEKEYKEMVSKESLRLRDEGMPVTLIDKVIKLQIRVIESQISREWGNSK